MNNIPYTDYSWLKELVACGRFGPIDHPIDFDPLRVRLAGVLREHPVDLLPMLFSIGYEEEFCYDRNTVKVQLVDGVVHYCLNGIHNDLIKRLLIHNTDGPILRTYWRILCSHLQFSLFFENSASKTSYLKPLFFVFGDFPRTDRQVLSYCTNKPNDFCLVDPFFIVSNGYARLKQKNSSQSRDLLYRRDKVFWRGSASGVKNNDFMSSQRFLLCHLAQQSSFSRMLDFGLVDTPPKYLERVTQEFGHLPDYLISERVDPEEFANYRYGIDVDGNSNSWGGFYTKMLSKSFLIKIKSLFNYRQWYYPRIDGEWFLTMAADLSDFNYVFFEVFEMSLAEKQEKANSLFEFAMSMDVISEIGLNNEDLRRWLDGQDCSNAS